MGLSDSVERFVGTLLVVTPFYGWGWTQGVAWSGKSKPIEVPAPFHLRLSRLWNWEGERRGGIGQIEENGHDLDRHWVIFSTRHVGSFDFDEHIGQYNISIAPVEPITTDDAWPVCPGEGWIGRDGYAEIRASN